MEVTRLTVIGFAVGFLSLVAIAALIVLPGSKQRWRDKAEQRRLLAELPTDPEGRRLFLLRQGIDTEGDLAESYRRLATDDRQLEKFGELQTEAKRLLELLARESSQHKAVMERLLIDLK